MLLTALQVRVRPARPDDLEALCTIVNDAIDDGECLCHEEPMSLAQVRLYVEQNQRVHVAELEEADGHAHVVGGYMLCRNQPGRGSHVANATYLVARHARGHGVGHVLGEHSIELARSLGYRSMQYNAVVATNEPAVRLWRSLGFEIVGTLPEAYRRRDGSYVDLLIMHRTL